MELIAPKKLFHVSESRHIKIFEPRPADFYPTIRQSVVFAITETLLHNYLLPRDCPRVTYYAGRQTSDEDRKTFFGMSTAAYVVAVEFRWLPDILRTTLFCYEMPSDSFFLLDNCAGYYISYVPVTPVSVRPVYSILEELLKKGTVELRFLPELHQLANAVKRSSLQFSLIRMINLPPL